MGDKDIAGGAASYFSDSMTFEEMEKILSLLPANIYLKDAEGRYAHADPRMEVLRPRPDSSGQK